MSKRLAGYLLAAALSGCGPIHSSFVKVDDVALGRVVIYRNGVAFYERRATVTGGALTVSVPRDRVDDFLKSLTVVDAFSKKPLPVAIPREQTTDGGQLVMQLQLPTTETADVVLTYVTESPAWKPSYRVAVKGDGSVLLEGWAIVDNTSGEDWKNVYIGVGSSSALSFRYDLWSVRQVHRDTLASEERFAVAPPSGVSPYSGAPVGPGGEVLLSELSDDEIRRPQGHPGALSDAELAALAEVEATSKEEVIVVTGSAISRRELTTPAPISVVDKDSLQRVQPSPPSQPAARPPSQRSRPAEPPPPAPRVASGDQKVKQISQSLVKSDQTIVIEGYAGSADAEASRRASDRANLVRNQLIDQGVAPARIKIVTKVEAGKPERVRLVAQAAEPKQPPAAGRPVDLDTQPVGESHFASERPMTVDKGSSAMVAIVHDQTGGEVVYLYDAESSRGNAQFAFRAVRFKNPTDSTLETGPVTVYGDDRFIGEGMTEPIPPRASAVVPYALDRQIVVERSDGEDDKLSRLLTLQRGILTAEVQHVRRRKLTLTNRLGQIAKVFVRHTVAKGWTVLEAPPAFERIGDAHLFEIHLAPHEVKEIMLAEATPIERTLDLGADVTLEMMKVWLDTDGAAPELKDQLRKLLAIHKSLVDLGQAQDSARRRRDDYSRRMDELHRQIFTLQAVRTGGDLMAHLKARMKDITDRVQKTTIQIVDIEEKLMLARVRFQDALAELSLPDALTASRSSSKPAGSAN